VFVQGRFILDIMVSTWESFEWPRETGQQCLFFKIVFDMAYD
jgi:hypothetical protein